MDYQTQTTEQLIESLQALQQKSAASLSAQSSNPDGPSVECLAIELQIARIERELQGRQVLELQSQLQSVRKEQELLRTILDLAPNFIFAKDQDGKFILSNRAHAEFTGARVEEIIGKSDADFNPLAEQVRRFLEDDREVLETGRDKFIAEEKSTNARGQMRWLQTIKRPLFGPDGKARHVLGIATDITERMELERRQQALSSLGESLSAATSREGAAQIIADISGALLGWDGFSLELYSAEEDKFYAVLHIDIVDGKKQKIPAVYSETSPNEFDRRILRSNGKLILKEEPITMAPGLTPFGDTSRPTASLMFVPIRDRTQVIGMLSLQSYTLHAYDQNDLQALQLLADHCGGALTRIRAEQSLRASEARFRRLAESNLIGITFWDSRNDVTDANDAFLKMVGYSREDLLAGKINTRGITPAEWQAKDQNAGDEIKARGFCDAYEKQYIRKNGSRVDVFAGAALLEGKADCGVSFVVDISERKRVERFNAILSKLAESLSAAATPPEAARIIADASDELLGWDSCHLDLYRVEHDTIHHVLNIDTIGGQRQPIKPLYHDQVPTPMQRRVLEQGQQLILRSEPYSLSGDTRPYGNTSPSASLIFVPIRNRTQTIGFFSVQSYQHNAYDQDDLNTLQTLADHCGGALERIRAQEEIAARARQQSAVATLGFDALAGTDLQALMDEAARLIVQTLGLEFSDILKFLPASSNALLMAGVGWKKELIGSAKISAQPESLIGYALQTQAPVIIENLKLERRFRGADLLYEHNVISGLTLIIPGRFKPWGLLGAYTTQRRTFTQDDVHFLQAIANLLAESEERKRYEERLQIFKEMDYAILAARSSEAIADVTVRGAERLVPCDVALILITNEEMQETRALAVSISGVRKAVKKELVPEQFVLAQLLEPSQEKAFIAALANLCAIPKKNFQSLFSVPLLSGGNLTGVFVLGSIRPDAFSSEHREIAHELASQLSIAIINAQLFEQVSAGRERLQILSLRLEEVQDIERRNLARELHDEIGQVLTGLKMILEIKMRIIPEIYHESLSEARYLVGDLLKRIQELSLNLRPQLLDDLGLLPALKWHFDRYSSQTEVAVEFKHAGLDKRLSPEIERTAYRIVQEALTNVARHSQARQVAVRLWISDGMAGLQIEDKGCGFESEKILAERVSCGLSGMRERVALLGGRFNLESAPGAGTQLTIELPTMMKAERKNL